MGSQSLTTYNKSNIRCMLKSCRINEGNTFTVLYRIHTCYTYTIFYIMIYYILEITSVI